MTSSFNLTVHPTRESSVPTPSLVSLLPSLKLAPAKRCVHLFLPSSHSKGWTLIATHSPLRVSLFTVTSPILLASSLHSSSRARLSTLSTVARMPTIASLSRSLCFFPLVLKAFLKQ